MWVLLGEALMPIAAPWLGTPEYYSSIAVDVMMIRTHAGWSKVCLSSLLCVRWSQQCRSGLNKSRQSQTWQAHLGEGTFAELN